MTKQDRSNVYLMKGLENECPAIYANWKAGKYSSPRQALLAAGLRQPAKPLNTLKKAWSNVSLSEKTEFVKWIKAGRVPTTAPAPGPTKAKRLNAPIKTSSVVGPDDRLLPAAKARIRHILKQRRMRLGAAMKATGFTNIHDASLGMALADCKPCVVRPELQRALKKWIERNKAIK